MNKNLCIFETNAGYGPTLHVEASNEIKAYEAARKTLKNMNMPFELELIEIRDVNKTQADSARARVGQKEKRTKSKRNVV